MGEKKRKEYLKKKKEKETKLSYECIILHISVKYVIGKLT